MVKPLPRLLALLALSCAAGCSALFGEEKVPTSAPAPPPPQGPETCATSWMPAEKADTPPASAFQAALGKLESSPEVQALLARLGPPKLAPGLEPIYVFPDRGVELRLWNGPSGYRLDHAVFYRKSDSMSSYAGTLPDGLSFSQTAAEAEKALGTPDSGKCPGYGLWCGYRGRRLSFQTDTMECVGAVEIFRTVEDGRVRFEDVAVQEHTTDHGVHGITVSWRQAVGPIKGGDVPLIKACVVDAAGKPPKQAPGAPPLPPDGELCAYARSTGSYRDSSTGSAFFSYVALGQAPGPVSLGLALSASVRSSAAPQDGGAASFTKLEPDGESVFDVRWSAPPLMRARLHVLRAEVDQGKTYDDINKGTVAAALATGGVSLLVPVSERWARPDLKWSVHVGATRVYGSAAIQDSYSAAWGSPSSPLLLAPDDIFSICLDDEDEVTADERIECFELSMDTYNAHASSKAPLSRGLVKKLVLGPAVVSK